MTSWKVKRVVSSWKTGRIDRGTGLLRGNASNGTLLL